MPRPRFTVRRMMLVVAVVAVVLGIRERYLSLSSKRGEHDELRAAELYDRRAAYYAELSVSAITATEREYYANAMRQAKNVAAHRRDLAAKRRWTRSK